MTFEEWASLHNWVFTETCNCRPKRDKYVNQSFPRWQVWYFPGNKKVQVRRTVGTNNRDTKVMAFANESNYEFVINHHIK